MIVTLFLCNAINAQAQEHWDHDKIGSAVQLNAKELREIKKQLEDQLKSVQVLRQDFELSAKGTQAKYDEISARLALIEQALRLPPAAARRSEMLVSFEPGERECARQTSVGNRPLVGDPKCSAIATEICTRLGYSGHTIVAIDEDEKAEVTLAGPGPGLATTFKIWYLRKVSCGSR
jgi:HPt (histidine-containing phosphotransfer) domain-containing protein